MNISDNNNKKILATFIESFDCKEKLISNVQVPRYPSQATEGTLMSNPPMDLRSPAAPTLTREEDQAENNKIVSSSSSIQTSMDVTPSPLPSMPVLDTTQEDEDDLLDPQGPKLVMAVWE